MVELPGCARLFVSVRGQIICCVRRFGRGSCGGVDCACSCRNHCSCFVSDAAFGDEDAGENAETAEPAAGAEGLMENEYRGEGAGCGLQRQDQTDALRTDVLLRRGLQDEAEGGAD